MTCNTCHTPLGQIARGTEDRKPPTWRCVNGHEQPWGPDVRPDWIEAAARACAKLLPKPWCAPHEQGMFADAIEREWRKAGGKS